jgi:hypothetical protein
VKEELASLDLDYDCLKTIGEGVIGPMATEELVMHFRQL